LECCAASCRNGSPKTEQSKIVPPKRASSSKGSKESKDSQRSKGSKDTSESALLAMVKESIRAKFKSRREAFEKLDQSRDSKIDLKEFQKFLSEELGHTSWEQVENLFNEIDDDKDGNVSYAEFRAHFGDSKDNSSTLLKQVRECIRQKFKSRQEAFKKLDASKDAKVDLEEFKTFLRVELGHESLDQIEELFNEIDDDRDGSISQAEFKAHFRGGAPGESSQCGSALLKEARDVIRAKFKTRQEAFNKLDVSKDAKIDLNEFGRFLREELDHNIDSAQVEGLFLEIDDDKDGNISASEFRAHFGDAAEAKRYGRRTSENVGKEESAADDKKKKRNSLKSDFPSESSSVGRGSHDKELDVFKDFMKSQFKDPKEAFKRLDVNQDKAIEPEEMRKILKDLGFKGDAHKVFEQMDDDKDGLVSWQEFLDHTKNSGPARRTSLNSNDAAEKQKASRSAGGA